MIQEARNTRIDGLRCLAILFVLIEHFGDYLARFFSSGYYGVDLFFVISGYLITGILLKNTGESFGSSLKTFIGRRTLRIFPPYYALIGVLLLVGLSPARELWGSLVTYTYNYAVIGYREQGNENHLYYLWSLSVEEQFYLVWPLLVLGLRRRKRILMFIVVAVVIAGYAQLLWNIVPQQSRFNYTGLFNRMGSLGLGALGAVAVAAGRLPRKALFESIWVELAVFAALAISLTTSFNARFPIMGLCSLFIVIKAARFDFRLKAVDWFLTAAVPGFIGRISYGIYLFHLPVAVFLTKYLFDPAWSAIPFEKLGPLSVVRWHSWVVKLPLFSLVSIGVAALSYRWFETPILNLKEKWFPAASRKRGDATAGGGVNVCQIS